MAHVDPLLVAADMNSLRSVAEPVRDYVNKVLAHRERAVDGQPLVIKLTFDEVNTSLDEVGRVTKRYYSLRHPGTVLASLTPGADLMFLNMFKEPWYRDDFHVPDALGMG